MALGERQSDNKRHKITGDELAAISSSFALGIHIELQSFPGESGMLYQTQKLEEDIDELRRYVTNEATSSAVNLKDLNGGSF